MSIRADILNQLIDVLAELYPDQASARTMAQNAGLNLVQISFDAKASNTWNSVLDEAEKQDRTQNLLNRAQNQYPRHKGLKLACQAYGEWVTAGWPSAPYAPLGTSPSSEFFANGRAANATVSISVDATTPASFKIKILFLAANPNDTTRLRLDEEVRAIDQSLRLAQYRDVFTLEQAHAVRFSDLQGLLMRYQPHVVHFSGHGSRDGKIILEDESGQAQTVSARALSTMFSLLKDNIRCVVLNACYSEVQGKAIAESIDCVVGMSTAIGDQAAINFASAFYQALGFGRSIKTAFDLGCNRIDLASLDEQDTPQLLAMNVDPVTVSFAR